MVYILTRYSALLERVTLVISLFVVTTVDEVRSIVPTLPPSNEMFTRGEYPSARALRRTLIGTLYSQVSTGLAIG